MDYEDCGGCTVSGFIVGVVGGPIFGIVSAGVAAFGLGCARFTRGNRRAETVCVAVFVAGMLGVVAMTAACLWSAQERYATVEREYGIEDIRRIGGDDSLIAYMRDSRTEYGILRSDDGHPTIERLETTPLTGKVTR